MQHLYFKLYTHILCNSLIIYSSDAFKYNTMLQKLKLFNNDIVAIWDLRYMPNQLELRITTNPLHCNESISWLLYVPSAWTLEIDPSPCASPARLMSTAWSSITIDDLRGM